jgi:ABC-type lipoprotein release transport system permease subunit
MMVVVHSVSWLAFASQHQLPSSRPNGQQPLETSQLKLTTIGLAIALPISVAVGRAMASLIFGVVSLDFSIFVAVASLFLVIALATAYLPARRATRIDPITALRYD